MENTNQYPDAILQLLKSKDFSALNMAEKEQVEAFLDEDLYAELYQAHSAITAAEKSFTADLKVRPKTHTVLLNALQKKKKPTLWHGITQCQVPAWQAAAAVLIIIFSFLAMQQNAAKSGSSAMATITDTVEVVKKEIQQVLVHDTVYLPGKSSETKGTKQAETAYSREENQEVNEAVRPLNFGNLSVLSLDNRKHIKASGNSLSDDTLVNKFNFVTLN